MVKHKTPDAQPVQAESPIEATETAAPLPTDESVTGENPTANLPLKALFDRLLVRRVVVVDDNFEQVFDAALVMSLIVQHPHAVGSIASHFPGVALDIQNEALLPQLEATLAGLGEEAAETLRTTVETAAPELYERHVFTDLKKLLPPDCETVFLSPKEWSESRSALIEACTEDHRTLFLFDHELGDTSGLGFTKGSDIIRDLAESEKAGFGTRWYCGILSHILQPGDEVQSWQQLSQNESLHLRFFMPIAKASLREAPVFYGAVYRTVINTYTAGMKHVAGQAFGEALTSALAQFDTLDPIDFEHAVVKSSDDEGISEFETLIRLYGIMHRDKVKENVLAAANLRAFADAATAVKSVVDIGRELPEPSKTRLARIRHAELYEDDGLVNGYSDPLRNGDVFEIGEGDQLRLWVLIAQPCDLMVRQDGERAREDNFRVAVLVPVLVLDDGIKQLPSGLTFRLDHFAEQGRKHAAADFRDAAPVNLRVLDLVVFSKTGLCEVGPVKDVDPTLLIPTKAWEQRNIVLAKHFAKTTAEIETIQKQAKGPAVEAFIKAVIPRISPAKKLSKHGAYDSGKYSYPLRRTMRVREPLASALLAAFSRYLSREAWDHDFSGAA